MKTCPTCRSSYPADFSVCPRDGTPLVAAGVWTEGTVVRDKYRILTKVGQGGMGAVYKALHLRFDEVRALKVLSHEMASDAAFVKRFEHEAVLTRKLQHPNAVRIDDIDESEDGRPFIVMEFIEGRSLKRVIAEEGPLGFARTCAIIKQVAAALDAAHRLGVIHRDIKPDNIALLPNYPPGIVAPPGPFQEFAKVLDFGIAKVKEAGLVAASTTTLTQTGTVIGTPQYMSPEQAMGKRGDDLDGRSDIYSLGIVMYQMLTGQLPFKADTTLEFLIAHAQLPPTPIRALCPELQIPEGVANVVMRCLEKKREMRPVSAHALIEELERAEKESAVELTPTRVVTPEVPKPTPPAPPVPEPAVVVPPEPPAPPPPMPVVVKPEPPPAPAPKVAVKPEPPPEPVVLKPEPAPPTPKPPVVVKPSPPAPQPRPVNPPGPKFAMTSSSERKPISRKEGREMLIGTLVLAALIIGIIWYTQSHHQPDTNNSPVPTESAPQQPTSTPIETEHHPKRTRSAEGSTQHAEADRAEVEKKVQTATNEGDTLYQNGDYDNAIAAYQRALALRPGDADILSKIDKVKNAKAAEGKINQ